MPIPVDHQLRFAYHFTHLDNLPGILKHGLLSPNEQRRRRIKHHSIAEKGIQDRRAEMQVTCGPRGVVHDYVPFYFCKRSRMLLRVVNGKNVDQEELIYFVLPIDMVERRNAVFTDASANTATPPHFFCGGERLDELTWDDIDSQDWNLGDTNAERRRMAELLVRDAVDLTDVTEIIVWDDSVAAEVARQFRAAKKRCPGTFVDDRHYHYYDKWFAGSADSLVTGPKGVLAEYRRTRQFVEETGQNDHARHQKIRDLLDALRGDFGCIHETAEIDGLETDNKEHLEDVGAHTRRVVSNLHASAEFKALSEGDQRITELAAYLHDIGKGPKNRWTRNGGKQQTDPDHPVESVKMLRRILTDEIREIKPRTVRVLSMLVCYHDLLGDIAGKGRHMTQLDPIIKSERDLEMLIALSLADVQALRWDWHAELVAKLPEIRAHVRANLASGASEDEE